MREKKQIHEWAIDHACAAIRGYEVRRQYLERHASASDAVTRRYAKYNRLIDSALNEVCGCKGEAEAIRDSIIQGVPWERIPNCPCGRRRFYELKREVIERTAQLLRLF